MNKPRRKQILDIIDRLQIASDMLEEVKAAEEEARDNVPENLQETERYYTISEACDSMDEALDSLLDIIDSLLEIAE